jgi:hypothetical protein
MGVQHNEYLEVLVQLDSLQQLVGRTWLILSFLKVWLNLPLFSDSSPLVEPSRAFKDL